jgi:transposase
VDGLSGVAYIPLKSNSTDGASGGILEKMFLRFLLFRDRFLEHYHLCSNVESTFSAIKRKFRDSVRSEGDVTMANEVLCKILAHNLCCCIAEWYALGIEPAFPNEELSACDGQARLLRFPW